MESRKSGFFIVLISAMITFGTLFVTLVPRHFHQMKHHCMEMKKTEESRNPIVNQ